MADTKISGLTAIDAVAGGDEFAVHDASVADSRKVTATQIAAFVSPAASATVAGVFQFATGLGVETGTNTSIAVPPGLQHRHPSAAKFWVKWTANSTTMTASYNMTSIADTAVGDADGTIATDFSGAEWCGKVTTLDATNGWDNEEQQGSGFNAQAAGTFGVLCSTMTDGNTAVCSLTDPDSWHVVGFGDHN